MNIARVPIAELDAAIFGCTCTFCGAPPGQHCRAMARTRTEPGDRTATYPHMARVHAGHIALRLVYASKQLPLFPSENSK